MTKQHINIGQSANDTAGDPLRTAFSKVNANFDELFNHVSAGVVASSIAPTDPGEGDLWWDTESGRMYVYYSSTWVDASPVDGVGVSNTDRLVSGDAELVLVNDGTPYVTFPVANGSQLGIQGSEISSLPGTDGLAVVAREGSILLATHGDQYPSLPWEFDRSGTINTPLLFPLPFTAVLDAAHCITNPNLSTTGPAWEFHLEWQVAPNGQIECISDNGPLPSLIQGYANGQVFEFTEADHGIPNYTLTIELYNLVNNAGLVNANLSFSAPPVYPSTVASQGAIKLSANTNSWTFGTDGRLLLGNAGAIYADQTTGMVTIGDSIGPDGTPVAPSTVVNIGGTDNAFSISAYGPPAKTWAFGRDGSLTLPLNGSLVVEGTTYTQLADAETTYTDNEVMYQDALTQWMTTAAFKPVWFALSGREAYDLIIAWTTPDGVTPPPVNLVPLAYACKTSYLTWQDLIVDSKLAVKSVTTSFEFDSSGKLKLPQGGTIAGGDPTSVQAAYDAWQATEDDWTYLITTGGAILEPRPWTYAAPDQRQATVLAMWAAQQSGDTLDWTPISQSFYNEVRAWLAVNTNSAVLYNTWKKLSTGVNITAEDSTWSFTYDGSLTFPDATVQTTAFTKNITSDNGSYYLNVSNTGIETGGVFKWLEDTTERVVMNYVAADDRFVISTSRVINSKYWYFGDDGSTTLPSGAGFGLGESGQLKVHDGNTTSLDLRDASGRGFYTNSDGFSLRGNGSNTWAFKPIGTLNLPNFGAVPGAGDGAVGDICRNGDVLYFKTSSGWATIGLTL